MTPRVALRCGRYQDVLAGVTCDALITDPPYSQRTAEGQRGNRTGEWLGSTRHSGITYGHMTESDVHELVRSWTPRTRRWFVMFGDHLTVAWALAALEAAGWYHFPPVPWAKTGAAPRIAADGPSPHAEFLAIARPVRRMVKPELRYRPGWYHGSSRGGTKGLIGSKPLWLLSDLVRDYSEPGDVVCDPCAGSGTTLVAARDLGRHAIGSERDPDTFALARERLSRPPAAEETSSGRRTDRDKEPAVQAVGKRADKQDRRAGATRAGRAEAKGRKKGGGGRHECGAQDGAG